MTAEFGTNPPDGRSKYCVPLCTAAVLHIHSPNRLDVIACDLLPTPISCDSGALEWPSSRPWLTDCSHVTSSERSILCASLFLPLTSLVFLSNSFFSFDLRGLSPTTMARLSAECHHTTEITGKWAVCTRLGQEKSAVEWRHLKYLVSLDFFGPTSYFLFLCCSASVHETLLLHCHVQIKWRFCFGWTIPFTELPTPTT